MLKQKLEKVISTLQEIAREVEPEKEEKVLDSKGTALTPWRSVIVHTASLNKSLFIGTKGGWVDRISLAYGGRSFGDFPQCFTESFRLAPEISELFRQKYGEGKCCG